MGQPTCLARTAASMLVLSSSVTQRIAPARPAPASSRRSPSSPSPLRTMVRSSRSAARSAMGRLISMTLTRTRSSRASSASATARPTLPPPTITTRSVRRFTLPKISTVRPASSAWVITYTASPAKSWSRPGRERRARRPRRTPTTMARSVEKSSESWRSGRVEHRAVLVQHQAQEAGLAVEEALRVEGGRRPQAPEGGVRHLLFRPR